MTSKIPCPMCGSENEVGAAYCTVCGYHLQQQASNAGGHKCARCGSRVPEGYDFCPVCGLDQRHRFARPATQVVNVSENGSTPSQAPYVPAGPEGMTPAGAAAPNGAGADRTVPAPGLMQGYPSAPQGEGAYPPGGESAYDPPYGQDAAGQGAAYGGGQPGAYGHEGGAQPGYGPESGGGPGHGGAAQGSWGPAQPPYGPEGAAAAPAHGPAGAPDGQAPHESPPAAQAYAPSGGTDPALGRSPAAPPVPAPPPPASVAQTGRTEFHEGPPLARPPRVQDEDLTVPVPSRRPTAPPAPPASGPSGTDATHPEPPAVAENLSTGTLRGEPQGWLPAGAESEARPPSLLEAPAFEDIPTGTGGPSAPVDPSSTPTHPSVNVRLVLVGRDGEEGESFPMSTDAIAVGREHGEILFPEDAFMSPQHARVERSGEVFTLVDLGSTNGVYMKIRGNAAVYPGDLFMVGHQVLRLENVVEAVQEQPPGPDGTRSFGTPLKPAWGKLALVGRGGVAGDTYFLRGAKVIFGRELGDILFPHDPFVSREHARLRLELHGAQMAVFLEDLGSANGTYIRIRGSAEVRGRDTFRIGDQILRLRLDR